MTINTVSVAVPPLPSLPQGGHLLGFRVRTNPGEPFPGCEYADDLTDAVRLWVECGTRRYGLAALARVNDGAPPFDMTAVWFAELGTWSPWTEVEPNPHLGGLPLSDIDAVPLGGGYE